MIKPKKSDLILSYRQGVAASAMRTYMRSSGWVPKGETQGYKEDLTQETVQNKSTRIASKNQPPRQRNWVAWVKA
ncbi:hypothetical protein [uncultured Pontibacter sp.]|uniref:hypothetical protein n=1 Tax=uncultured Pontibacter sp. TaxID=453356 RepID=UPI0026348FF0|nr:hypothetical protein [uncultured Pontibacter sp.]